MKKKAARPSIPCPSCSHPHSEVVRTSSAGGTVRRVRRCLACDRFYPTREAPMGKSDTGITLHATDVALLAKLVAAMPQAPPRAPQSHQETQ